MDHSMSHLRSFKLSSFNFDVARSALSDPVRRDAASHWPAVLGGFKHDKEIAVAIEGDGVQPQERFKIVSVHVAHSIPLIIQPGGDIFSPSFVLADKAGVPCAADDVVRFHGDHSLVGWEVHEHFTRSGSQGFEIGVRD